MIITKPATDLVKGDVVVDLDRNRSFTVLTDATPFDHFLLTNQVRVRGTNGEKEGWVEFSATHKVSVEVQYSDTAAIDAIATMIGTAPDYDFLDIGHVIALIRQYTNRPECTLNGADDYAERFLAATGRAIPDEHIYR